MSPGDGNYFPREGTVGRTPLISLLPLPRSFFSASFSPVTFFSHSLTLSSSPSCSTITSLSFSVFRGLLPLFARSPSLLSLSLFPSLSTRLLVTEIASVARRGGRRKVLFSFSLSFFPPFLCLDFSLFLSLNRLLSIRRSIYLYRPHCSPSLSLSISLATLFFCLPPSLLGATDFLFRRAFSFLLLPPFLLLTRCLSLLLLPFFVYHLEDSSSCLVFFAIKSERKEGR